MINAAAAFNQSNSFSLKINTNFSKTNAAYVVANAAFAFANSLPLSASIELAGAAFDKANMDYIHASAAFDQSNNLFNAVFSGSATANGAYGYANGVSANTTSVYRVSNSVYNVTNSCYAITNAVYSLTNSSYNYANTTATVLIPAINTKLNAAFIVANAAFSKTNTAYSYAVAAWDKSNTALQNTTGTFQGSLTTTGTLTAPNIVASQFHSPGSVIQVKQTVKTNIFTTTSTSPVDVTGLSVSITPKYATSKILVLVDLSWTGSGHSDAYLVRGVTKLFYGDAASPETQASLHQYSNPYGQAYGHICYLDSPATTSATTYKIQVASPYSGYTIGVNYPYPNQSASYNARTASSITVMEIAQ